MPYQDHLSYLAVYALFEVELQVDAHDDLGDQNEHDDRDEFGVDVVLGELAALMSMTQEVADDGKDGARDLYGNVPFGANYLSSVSTQSTYCSRQGTIHLGPFLWGR